MATEQEQIETMDETGQIPDQLAVLPISDAVIFPYMMVPLVLSDSDLLQLADDEAGPHVVARPVQAARLGDQPLLRVQVGQAATGDAEPPEVERPDEAEEPR